MIMSSQARSPFSRHNKNNQSFAANPSGQLHVDLSAVNGYHKHGDGDNNNNSLYSSGASGRKPAPKQPAPERPTNGITNGQTSFSYCANGYRSLNRLDILKRRQQQQQQKQQRAQLPSSRNLSSLGQHPAAGIAPTASNGQQVGPLTKPIIRVTSPSGRTTSVANNYHQHQDQIYAPASIGSPRELANYRQKQQQQQQQPSKTLINYNKSTIMTNGNNRDSSNIESHHYAATSYRASARPASESGRSGRESALGQLLDKFDTLRRRARWSRSMRNKTTPTPNGIYSTPRQKSSPSSTARADLSSTNTNGNNIPSDEIIYGTTKSKTKTNSDSDNNNNATQHKKHLEADEIYAEGLRAIDGNAQKRLLEHELNVSLMAEGETRWLIDEQSRQQAQYKQLVGSLINWINDELAEQRIIVRDLQDDLFDGQVLCKLIEKLQLVQLDIVEVTQNEQTQKFKLKTVLDTINRILALQARWARIRWSVDGIHAKNLVEIIHLLVALALYYRAPIRLPPNVYANVFVVQKQSDRLVRKTHQVQLTDSLVLKLDLDKHKSSSSSSTNPIKQQQQQLQRDAFDTLFEYAPDKLDIVKQALVRFVNRHLNKINMSCLSSTTLPNNYASPTLSNQTTQLDPDQFSDGLLFVFLISSLEGYFVPLGNLFTATHNQPSPTDRRTSLTLLEEDDKVPFIDGNNNNNNSSNNDDDSFLDDTYASCQQFQTALEPSSYINAQPIEKLHNINVALQLIEEAGIDIKQRVRAEDIANGDLKTVLRILYALFSRYKHV